MADSTEAVVGSLRRLDRLALRRKEAAALLGVSTDHLDDLIRERGLPVVRLGGSRALRIPRQRLEDWLDELIEQGSA